MFYIKDENNTKIELDGEAFTLCPDCGEEHKVDILELALLPSFDFYGTNVCCENCTEKRRAART